jgi:hypothetical protein
MQILEEEKKSLLEKNKKAEARKKDNYCRKRKQRLVEKQK